MNKAAPSQGLLQLRQFYSSNLSVRAMLDDLANRANNQRVTKVDQVLNRLRTVDVRRSEVIAAFRKFEEFGYGKFVEGRRGHPSRFVWTSNLIDVGKAAQGDEAQINPVSADAEIQNSIDETREYVFPLRTGTDVKFTLPVNLADREVDRLSAFLKTLALPDA